MQEELSQLWESITRIRTLIKKLKKYRSNTHYKQKYDQEILSLNRNYKFFKAKIKPKKSDLMKKLGHLYSSIEIITSEKEYKTKLDTIEELERFWPDLEVEIIEMKSSESSFQIPKEIPMNEQRLDLEEAIRDFNEKCYLSCLVLCRRAYEGALSQIYKTKTKVDPIQDVLCPKCSKKINSQYMGITKLHNWALKEKIISDKLKSVGYLTADLGAGGAHPPLHEFPRDPELAKLGIQATITLLKQIYS